MGDKYYKKEMSSLLEELSVDELKGLSNKEACNRLEQYGSNIFSKPKEKSMLQEIRESLTQQLIVILLIAAGISMLIREYHDAIGICLAVLIGSLIGILTESRSKKAAEALAKMADDIEVKVLRNKEKIVIHKSELVPGDIIFLESGDRVPADGRIISSMDLKVREDMLTGESHDVNKKPGIIEEDILIIDKEKILQDPSPSKQHNMLFGGTLIAYGSAKMIVTATGDHTEMGHIAKALEGREEDTPLEIKMDGLGRSISKISTGIAGLLFLYMLIQIIQKTHVRMDFTNFNTVIESMQPILKSFPEIKTAFIICVALIVAAVPEGLPTMINITLAITMKQMAKINVLVRKKEACETIGGISVICSDKTGTLTQNKMKVTKLYLGGRQQEMEEISSYPSFLDNCMINSTADIEKYGGEEKYRGSATECALLSLCKDYKYEELRCRANIVKQIPFSSENKYMLTIILKEDGYEILSKGAPEMILNQCGYENIDGDIKELTEKRLKEIYYQIGLLQSDAMRVLAFAYQKVPEEQNVLQKEIFTKELIFNGFVGITDPLREGVKEALETAKEAGIETKMLTGDNIQTATAIGKEIGLIQNGMRVVEASYIDTLSEEKLCKEISTIAIVARSKPDTKMRIVQALQKNGEVVAVTGDGINDAPALNKADVGIAMGVTGTEVSKNAADIILTDDSFSTIVEAIKWGRGTYNNFQRFIQFQLTVNIIAFLIAIISQLMGREMPFTTIHLLWINIIMDGPPALALGLEPIRATVMKRKPIKRDANIINSFMIRTILINSTFITLLLFAQIKWNFLGAADYIIGNASEKQTVLFSLFAFSVLFNALNCREFGTGSIIPNFLKNKLALRIILLTAIVQVMMTQFGSSLFNTMPLTKEMWFKIILCGSAVVIGNEAIKALLRTGKKSAKTAVRRARRIYVESKC
ncbi:MAG: calcium-translocating P-type ATPase, PMCA-type [Clostridia bacterium]|jgi:Ca2+-transporting ATPase|nr:calcium-translocating P-type ATPase, PMCA-type [Clostridia bacterium]